jgi:asparagine synthase (glutamine-hydrolysing)
VAEFAGRLPPTLKMRTLNEKYILKRAAADLIPPFLHKRPKQPYRSMEVPSFYDTTTGRARFDYVDELLSERTVRDVGLFKPSAVARLVEKARRGQVIGVKDSMALVAILSSQLTAVQFVGALGRFTG